MRFYYFLVLLTSIEAKTRNKFCDIVSSYPYNHCYIKETLTSIAHSPNQMAVDRTTNTLYFSFDFGQGEYVPAILQIDTKKLRVLKGVKDAFAISNDPTTGDMYFGGSHGIYKYSASRKSLMRLNNNNLDIWWLFYKKKIYFIKFPSLSAYSYDNKSISPVKQLDGYSVHQFVLDVEDDIFFINGTGLFGIKKHGTEPVLLRDSPKFLGIALDNKGMVHVCSDDGIFVISKVVQKVKKVVNIQGVLGLAFDSANNIIYSDSHDIVRLVPVEVNNYQGLEYDE